LRRQERVRSGRLIVHRTLNFAVAGLFLVLALATALRALAQSNGGGRVVKSSGREGRSYSRPASTGAPDMPALPPMTSTRPKSPLFASLRLRTCWNCADSV
jgi:uncharacterized membrane protein